MDQPDILNSLNSSLLDTEFLSVSDRYYEHKYCIKFSTKEKNLDQRISFHSNRICMISLADNHPVMKKEKKINKINCLVNKIDRSLNSASGKGKRGAQKLSPDSVLCYIECEDGTLYPVYSCLKGKLLEINESLLSNPNLLVEKPIAEGYIALLLPVLDLYTSLKDSMLSREEYCVHIKQEVELNDGETLTEHEK